MLKVGLTGGIGSGKTTVAKVFEILGIPVYYADEAARHLMNEDESLKQKIQSVFGKDIYDNGALDRKRLAALVFNDPEKLASLNSIVHPATIEDAENWVALRSTDANGAPAYIIKEAALLFESNAHKHLNYVIGVYAPTLVRIQRVMQRDNTNREAVMARMSNQLDEEQKMQRCNFVVNNDEQQLLLPQVLALHEQLLTLANKI